MAKRKDKTVGVRDLLRRGFHPARTRATVHPFAMKQRTLRQTGRRFGPPPKALPPEHSYPMDDAKRDVAYLKQSGRAASRGDDTAWTPAQRKRRRQKTRTGAVQP